MNNIKADLILNQEGAVYHLGLRPDDICPIVITAGDPDRIRQIASHLDYLDRDFTHREFHSIRGRMGNKRILIISTGIGPDNIDIVMNELHTLFLQAKAQDLLVAQGMKFIRLGTSGTISSDHPLDSILISSHAFGMDNIPSFYRTQWDYMEDIGRHLPHYQVSVPGNLWKKFTSIPSSTIGTTLTCPGFYGPQFRYVHLPPSRELGDVINTFKKNEIRLSNIEMETAPLYFFANELGHQAVSISALIADRLTNQFSKVPGKIVASMIDSAMEIIAEL